MAGRGRGRRAMTFSVDAVGISRGESLPPSMQQPTPVFPVMEHKPLPLAGGEEAEYLLALKQEFRGAMKSLPCFIQPAAARRDVERYSDKYHSSEQTDSLVEWTPDWRTVPRELRVHVRKAHKDGVSVNVSDRVQSGQKKKLMKEKEVLLKLETLEKKEEQASSEDEGEEKKKKKEEEEEEPEEEEYDEEEFEEETDYIMSYFDNGEEFGGDSEDNMDEAVY